MDIFNVLVGGFLAFLLFSSCFRHFYVLFYCSHCNFTGATLQRTVFFKAKLPCCIFQRSQIADTDFSETSFVLPDFTGATLCAVDFSRANVPGLKITGLRLVRVNFTAANLTNALFSNTVMQDCEFEQAIVTRAMQQGCTLTRSAHQSGPSRPRTPQTTSVVTRAMQQLDPVGAVVSRAFQQLDASRIYATPPWIAFNPPGSVSQAVPADSAGMAAFGRHLKNR